MRLEYEIVYSKRRRAIGVTVERDNRVVVRAPEGAREDDIHKAVAAKKLWLFEKTRHEQKYPEKKAQKEFVTGETLSYRGRNYRLEITDAPVSGVVFRSKFVIARASHARAPELFRAWYTERALALLTARARHFARAMGADYNNVLVSDLKYRWGSCTPSGNLNFNWRIVKAPTFVLDYIVIHELAHLLEANHTPRFWNIVAVQLPCYEEARRWLKEHGNRLETDF